jgi:glycosyltransferase involved in cell wall biosynthesis
MAELSLYAKRAPKNVRVHLHGARPHDETLQILRSCDVMILPSKQSPDGSDGIPVAMMESMVAGVLVVSTPVGGIPELVVDGVTGLLGDPGDPIACGVVLAGVLATPGSTEEITARAFDHVNVGFNTVRSAFALQALVAGLTARDGLAVRT